MIDDDPDFPAALGSLVRSLGYKAECFSSAEDILVVKHLENSLVSSAIHMPNMSGLELVPELHRRMSNIPVILMTGRFEQGLLEKALA
ncbi:response regulator [Rhizobium tibeticum]|uniref:response regulator n=1 Tax=Rhizobium tibeticum TaxID=501024 RepID=UPI003520C004